MADRRDIAGHWRVAHRAHACRVFAWSAMKFTVIGAGAVGGTFGAFMSRAGHDVTFIDRAADHVAAINASGLQIEGVENFSARARACGPERIAAPLGVVVLAVKAQDTETAIAPVAPLLAADEYVVSLQNGLEEPK